MNNNDHLVRNKINTFAMNDHTIKFEQLNYIQLFLIHFEIYFHSMSVRPYTDGCTIFALFLSR